MTEQQVKGILYALIGVGGAIVIVLCIMIHMLASREDPKEAEHGRFERIFLSAPLLEKTHSQRIAWVGVTAALCIVSNCFELKFATTQFSLTIFTSVLAGILIGPILGAVAVTLGDGLGYLVNSMGYPYYWWVALACAAMALIAGFIMKLPFRFKGSGYVKLVLICLLTFAVCSVGINSAGMYYIGLQIYMPKDVLDTVAERFGGELTFGVYLLIRFFILGQIWNSLVNFALLFAAVPLLNAAKPLKIRIQ